MVKDLDYYMRLRYAVTLMPYPDGGYFAKIEDLPGCMTEGDNLNDAMAMIEDAKAAWISVALEDGRPVPEPDAMESDYSGRFVVRIPKSLHETLAIQAKSEGVSLNQLVLYYLARGSGYAGTSLERPQGALVQERRPGLRGEKDSGPQQSRP